jgi:hypothetical protein
MIVCNRDIEKLRPPGRANFLFARDPRTIVKRIRL